MTFRAPLFWLTGFAWLCVSGCLGIALFLSMIFGFPLPPVLRLLHVHAALVGGVAQIILGAMASFIPTLLMTGRDKPESHPLLYAAVNSGTLVLLAGVAAGQTAVMAAGGLAVLLAFLSVAKDAVGHVKSSLVSPPLNLWFYGVALLSLFLGLGMGEALALKLVPMDVFGQSRLVHIHLNLLGFVTMTIVGTMHNLFPTVLETTLFSPKLARWTFALMPTGLLLLIVGFLLPHLYVQAAAGLLLIAGTSFYGFNLIKTWLAAGRPSRAAVDHFMLATFFLFLAAVTGLLLSVNSLWDPPVVPIGRLHLVAYTHLALVGFVLQTIMGALTHLLPIGLAVGRVKSNKKRGPYLAELTALAERWRGVQVSAVNFGPLLVFAAATLVWQFSLKVPVVQGVAAAAAVLLAVGLLTFGAKVLLLVLRQPSDQSAD